jgi:hypothetical protein
MRSKTKRTRRGSAIGVIQTHLAKIWLLILLGTLVMALGAFASHHTAKPKPAPAPASSPLAAATVAPTPSPTVTPKPATPPPPTPAAKKRTVTQKLTAAAKPAPVVVPAPGSSVPSLTPTAAVATGSGTASPTPSSAPAVTTGYTSTNWSGYLMTGAAFTAVSGSWVATTATGRAGVTSADSSWIGIGGVTSGDLIQVGTDNIISSTGQVHTEAFFEMLPAASQPVPGLTVSPGDAMSASITQLSPGTWQMSITDRTTGETFSQTVAYASTLSSAEWIQEEPSSGRRLIPLDNFGTATFGDSETVAGGVRRNLRSGNAQPITLVNRSGTVLASPSAVTADGGGFTVTQ